MIQIDVINQKNKARVKQWRSHHLWQKKWNLMNKCHSLGRGGISNHLCNYISCDSTKNYFFIFSQRVLMAISCEKLSHDAIKIFNFCHHPNIKFLMKNECDMLNETIWRFLILEHALKIKDVIWRNILNILSNITHSYFWLLIL